MGYFEPRSSSVLSVSRFTDVDEFRSSLRSATVEIWPTRVGPISAMQGVLPLPDGEVYLLRTFPRIVDVGVPATRLLVVVPWDEDCPETIVNGQTLNPSSSLVLGRGPGYYRMIETGEGFGAALLLSSALRDRGWPPTGRMFVAFDAPGPALAELRRLIERAFVVASYFPSQLTPVAARLGLQEQLLVALDRAFAQTRRSDLVHSLSFQTALNIVDRLEEILRSDLGRPIYSNELAARLHVSVRTINSAMSKIRGMSLHRYLRARRLWSVRRLLLAGDATTQIKAIALANGFWHLSEFSSQYVARFGEHPSETLARAIGRAR
jgi:AraC family ethanolamine operon transcriptional activator